MLFVALLAIATVASGAQPGADTVHYQLRRGDSLLRLGREYLVHPGDYRLLQRSNHIRNPRRLPIGAEILIPQALLKTTPIEAEVDQVSGEAALTDPSGRHSLAKGARLHAGAVIDTGANAFVRLSLPDGSRVTLPSQSRLRLQSLQRTLLTGSVERSFVVERGRSESVVTPMTNPRDSFVVKTPLSVAAVRGTDFRVAFDPDAQTARVEVLEGKVAVATASGDASALVTPSHGASATAAAVTSPADLLAAPVLEGAAKVQQDPDVTLGLSLVAGAKGYRAELAADAGMLSPIAETEGPEPRLKFGALDDGDWFVRLTAIGPDGLEGEPQTYGFERILNSLDLKDPSRLEERRMTRWLFRWEPHGAGERSFRFQLFGAVPGAPPVIDETGLREPQIRITSLPKGAYHWRVESTLFRNGRTYEKWSPLQDFRIGD